MPRTFSRRSPQPLTHPFEGRQQVLHTEAVGEITVVRPVRMLIHDCCQRVLDSSAAVVDPPRLVVGLRRLGQRFECAVHTLGQSLVLHRIGARSQARPPRIFGAAPHQPHTQAECRYGSRPEYERIRVAVVQARGFDVVLIAFADVSSVEVRRRRQLLPCAVATRVRR